MEEQAAEYAGELAALEGLVANLGPLAGLLPERAAPEQDFNLFELLNQWWQEDVHSRCLTWLLDPQGSHGTGVYFLENFLLHTAERSASLGTPAIDEDCIRGGAWSDATSQREWYAVLDGGSGWLDILLVNEGRKIICAIENKIFSPESGRQLTFYQKALERDKQALRVPVAHRHGSGALGGPNILDAGELQRRSGAGGTDGGETPRQPARP